MDEYNLGLKISMAEDQENRRKMSFDFNDFDETINNKSTWNLLNTITTCLCFGIYAFSTIGNCAWWMIIILIIEAFILLLISRSVFSLYKDCKKKFKEIDRNNETFELRQKAGKPTEGVLWDNDDFNQNEVYGNKHGIGGVTVALCGGGRRPEDNCDYDHDGTPDCIEDRWNAERCL